MYVDYEEVEPSEDEFIITDAVNDIEVTDPEMVEPDNQEQFMFTFDFPKNPEEETQAPQNSKVQEEPEQQEPKKVVHRLSEDDLEEKESRKKNENAPIARQNNEGVTRYSLNDYMEVEQMLKNSNPSEKPKKEVEPEMKRTAPAEPEPAKAAPKPEKAADTPEDDIDPFNSPINESLVKRAAERRAKMKEFNYKFRNNLSKIEEIEKQPAYKRRGIDLDTTKPGEERISRTSLNTGDDDEIRFRTNNSFLHDNVD